MKISVIGAGSTYTPELLQGLLDRKDLIPLTELWLMDIDEEKLNIVGNFVKRIAKKQGSAVKIILTMDRREAVYGSSYIITQLRVGRLEARRGDEYLGARHGLVGQETTGVGGMAKGLRTIPVILDIAKDIRELAPEALLINFTNPSGMVKEALTRYAPDIQSIGLCNSAMNAKMTFKKLLEKKFGCGFDPQDVFLDTLGINHLSWHRGIIIKGKNYWNDVMDEYIQTSEAEGNSTFDPELLRRLGMIPSYYLEYYYTTKKILEKQKKWPPSRAEEVMSIEKTLLEKYADPKSDEVPPELLKRGGAYYSTAAAQMIASHCCNLGEIHVANVRNGDAVPDYPADWVLEIPCRIDKNGVNPLKSAPLPNICFGLMAHVKSYELLTVEAAVHGDRNAAWKALLAHPLGPDASEIDEVLEDMLETNKRWLPQFSVTG